MYTQPVRLCTVESDDVFFNLQSSRCTNKEYIIALGTYAAD